jgi:hypothetical protein
MYKTVEVDVDINVDELLDEVDTDDLIKELEQRRCNYNTQGVDGAQARELLESIYQLRCSQLPFDKPLDQLIWCVLGRVQ